MLLVALTPVCLRFASGLLFILFILLVQQNPATGRRNLVRATLPWVQLDAVDYS